MKAVSFILILLGLGAIGAGLATAPSSAPHRQPLPQVAMRGFGTLPAAAPAEPAAAPPAEARPAERPERPAEPAARPNGKALEKALEQTAEKPSDDLAAPTPKAEKVEKTEKTERAPPAPHPAPADLDSPLPPKAEKTEHVGEHAAAPPAPHAAPKPAAEETGSGEPAAPATAAVGLLNLRASDTADVYVDGKKVGGSPQLGFKVKPGKHKVRFDCYQATGETKPGITQTYDVPKDGARDVDYECP